MNTVKVNLLPRELAQARAARRVNVLSAAAVVVFLALLGTLYVLKLSEIEQAEQRRATVQAEVAALQSEVAGLQTFRTLAASLDARDALVASAMRWEVSYSRILNDLALAFPASSSLRALTVTLAETDPAAAEAGGAQPAAPPDSQVAASVTFDGYSVERYTPGVETVLIEFDKVPSFLEPFLTIAGEEEIGDTVVTAFQGSAQLTAEALTRRYADGLPEDLTP